MDLVINSLLSPELGSSPEMPPDPSDCWVTIGAEIGLRDSGCDIFNFYFVTLKRITSLLQDKGFCIGRHVIVVEDFSWDIARQAIESVIAEVSGKNWGEIAQKLAQYGDWEFDDYQE